MFIVSRSDLSEQQRIFATYQTGRWVGVGRRRVSLGYGKPDLRVDTLGFLVDECVRKNSRPSTCIGNEYIGNAFK